MRQTPEATIQRSTFDLSHSHKTSFDSGWLVPFYVEEALPGDTFNVKASIFARLSTPIVPIFDDAAAEVFFFAIPMRLVWSNFQRFMGEQDNPTDTTDYLVPQATFDNAIQDTGPNPGLARMLLDFMGAGPFIENQPSGTEKWTYNNLPLRAYNRVFNEWFRDQNLMDSAVVDLDDGPDNPLDYRVRFVTKKHDYFTSALPWPQKGPGVDIPITGMPVVPHDINKWPWFENTVGSSSLFSSTAVTTPQAPTLTFNTGGAGALAWGLDTGLVIGSPLTGETAGTINALRQAFQLQRLLERDARGGTRYTEIIKSHFGVTSPDARLQRTEYLGGGSIPLVVSPVPQTSGSGDYTSTPQGNLAATGVVAGTKPGFKKAFVEHSIILGLVTVRANLTYQYHQHKLWTRRTKLDFYWPALSNIGEQAILNREIYIQPDGTSANDEVFGYQERWAEYRQRMNRTSSIMSSRYNAPLDNWHLAEENANLPTLSEAWLTEPPPFDRVIAVTNQPQFLMDCYLQIKAARPLPTYSIPGMADHF